MIDSFINVWFPPYISCNIVRFFSISFHKQLNHGNIHSAELDPLFQWGFSSFHDVSHINHPPSVRFVYTLCSPFVRVLAPNNAYTDFWQILSHTSALCPRFRVRLWIWLPDERIILLDCKNRGRSSVSQHTYGTSIEMMDPDLAICKVLELPNASWLKHIFFTVDVLQSAASTYPAGYHKQTWYEMIWVNMILKLVDMEWHFHHCCPDFIRPDPSDPKNHVQQFSPTTLRKDTSIAFFACKCDSTFFALLWTPYACLLNDFSGGSGKVGQVILREKQPSLQLFNGSWMAAETEHPSCQWCRRDGWFGP